MSTVYFKCFRDVVSFRYDVHYKTGTLNIFKGNGRIIAIYDYQICMMEG